MKLTQSISFKLILAALLIVTTLVTVSGVYDYIAQSKNLKSKQNNDLQLAGLRLQLNLPSAVWNYEESRMEGILNSEQQSTDIAYIEILNEEKEQVAHSKGQKSSD